MEIRKGFESLESDFYDYFGFLQDLGFKVFHRSGRGAHVSITMTNGSINFTFYYEFIDGTLIVSLLKIGETTEITTYELNKALQLDYNEREMKPLDEHYHRALELHANVIRTYFNRLDTL